MTDPALYIEHLVLVLLSVLSEEIKTNLDSFNEMICSSFCVACCLYWWFEGLVVCLMVCLYLLVDKGEMHICFKFNALMLQIICLQTALQGFHHRHAFFIILKALGL